MTTSPTTSQHSRDGAPPALAAHPRFLVAEDGTRLYYTVTGHGPGAVVLCDGLGCDGFIWKYLRPQLERTHRVVHWHYRGHGKSDSPRIESNIGVEATIGDLRLLLDTIGVEQATVLGHSMGVQIALEFHRRHSNRVAALGLLCGSCEYPLHTWHDHDKALAAFPYVAGLVERFPSLVGTIFRTLAPSEIGMQIAMRGELNPALLAREDFAPYLYHLGHMDPRMFFRTLRSLKDHSAKEHLPAIDVPTLVVGGEVDRFTPVRLSAHMAEAIPRSNFVFVPGGSHTAPLERPGMVNAAVAQLLHSLS